MEQKAGNEIAFGIAIVGVTIAAVLLIGSLAVGVLWLLWRVIGLVAMAILMLVAWVVWSVWYIVTHEPPEPHSPYYDDF